MAPCPPGSPAVAALCAAIGLLTAPLRAQEPVRHHQDHVLGTSLDLAVNGDAAAAAEFVAAVAAEIERLDAILSRWRPDSPVSKLNRGETVTAAPPELLQTLELADAFRIRSSGAFDVRIGAIAAAWQQAAAKGNAPTADEVTAALARMRASAVAVDAATGQVTPKGALDLAIDGLAKGFVLDRALAAGRRRCPAVLGALLDLGGDAVAFGTAPQGRSWRIGIADPQHPAENAPLLAELELGARAIATSGGYARGYRIDGRLRSHILDPGTGQPVTTRSATVVAADAVLADALATTLCVLGPVDGLALVAQYADVACLIVDGDGRRHASPDFRALLAKTTPVGSAFAGGAELTIDLALPKIEGRRYKRPYVAVWIEDAAGHGVRSLALWGRERRWISELTNWWRVIDGQQPVVDAVSRASRGPGEYRLAWDGRDDLGLPVPAGAYTVIIEVSREHGGHTTSRAVIVCGGTASATASIAATPELAAASLRYGPPQDAR